MKAKKTHTHRYSPKKQTARIYYGPEGHETTMYWQVTVTDSRKTVTIKGSVAAALNAYPGVTVGCALSLSGMDNSDLFGHPVYLVSVTKSTLLAVDKLKKDGSPMHAVRYGHGYGRLVDLNDTGELKAVVLKKPEVMEREFLLRPPRKRPTGPHGNHKSKSVSGVHRAYIKPVGVLSRAVKAGRISKTVAQQLSVAMGKRKKMSATK